MEGTSLKDLNVEERQALIPDDLIFLGYRGSIAHGMYIPGTDPDSIDDKDVMGVFLAAPSHCIGTIKQKDVREQWYNEWEELLAIRDAFSSKQVYHSFVGYANSQLHRMTHLAFEGYLGQKRKSLVQKYGYDCKNAAHLVRLLRMGIEFLTEGILHVERRNDAAQLLEIKHGQWSLEAVKEEAARLFALCEEAYNHSPLPALPDKERINAQCTSILAKHLRA
jgi:hypothetical protein